MSLQTVLAELDVKPGDECIVNFPTHEDHESEVFHMNCHGERAVIIRDYEEDEDSYIDIKMTTGRWAGKVIEKVCPDILIFGKGFGRISE